MESATNTPSTTPTKKKSFKVKNKNRKAAAAAATTSAATPEATTNGHKPVGEAEQGSATGEEEEEGEEAINGDDEDIEAIRKELSDAQAQAVESTKKLSAETARADKLSEELEVLRKELAANSKSGGTSALELQRLHNELEAEKEAHVRAKTDAEKRIREIQEAKESVDAQYSALLGRVSTIRTTLGERMKADAEELAATKQTVEELEEQNRALNDAVEELRDEADKLRVDKDASAKELSSLRNRLNLSQQNWNKERADLINAERFAKEEYEVARRAMQDWEVIATEERAVRESLGDRVIELEDQLASQKQQYDRMAADYEKQSNSMDGLQRALQEIQDARKKELREIVENTQAQISALTTKCEALDKLAKEAESNLAAAKQDLERVLPFEKEVKEKNLLIGKLRHEAVTLNDHLRKALRMLKRDNAEDKIDKQLVTNVFLQFVSIQRGDQKKYEVLKLIASVLDWNDGALSSLHREPDENADSTTTEQKEKAGLLRPGTAVQSSNSPATGFFASLKTPPLTPFHRSPSTPSLGDTYGDEKDIAAVGFSAGFREVDSAGRL
ncbi:hypothetical protein FN846DRAFT_539826 [Sphaerosporella brunnea]|uniref:GRIP domain-containing protein n=1 Tax=Sphaerosporella brunnea TaxID=1250544 RepID=A0A5J5F2G9_9PEZI|nr:hypothetical protein FN846DRAFT_539826 [Sphaerosporella brunnea]